MLYSLNMQFDYARLESLVRSHDYNNRFFIFVNRLVFNIDRLLGLRNVSYIFPCGPLSYYTIISSYLDKSSGHAKSISIWLL